MALSANTVFEIRSTATANNVNGGGFVTGASGVDYSQQDAAQYALTGATSAGADAIILHASAHANMVGNIAKVVSGTNATVGWYEITAVDPGVSITVDRNWGTGAVADGVVNIGGALSLASTLDDDIFELPPNGGGVKYWVKSGTYTLGEAVSISQSGGTLKPNFIEGYATTRGDSPRGSTRPTFVCGSNTFTLGTNWNCANMIFTGTASAVLAAGGASVVKYCKVVNTSTTSSRNAASSTSDAYFFGCEMQALNGAGIASSGSGGFFGCYIHDCVTGITISSSTTQMISDCLIIGNKTAAIQFAGSSTNPNYVNNCTLYGHQTPTGIGVSIDAAATDTRVINSIISGFVTGVSHGATQTIGFDNNNCYYNNTTNATNWTLGVDSVTTNPSFANVGELTGATATTSGSVLTQSGGDFSTVTDDQDCVYIVSGTGVTAGMYPITSHTATTLTLGTAPGTSAVADKVWIILKGRDFSTNASIQAAPSEFYGSPTVNSSKIGAVQPSASAAGGSRVKSLGYSVFSS